MGVTLRKGKRTSKGIALYLDISAPGMKRKREWIGLYGTDAETMKLANRIRKNREMQIAARKNHVYSGVEDDLNFLKIHEEYKHQKDHRVYKSVLLKFQKFAGGNEYYPVDRLDNRTAEKFKKHLQSTLKGETPFGYFKKFKRMTKDLKSRGVIAFDPCEGIRNENPTRNDLKKDVLFTEEIKKLYATPCDNELVKKAFLFAFNAGGLRHCDVADLTWKEVKLQDKMIVFSQNKTGVQNMIPLNENAMDILVTLPHDDEKVFPGLDMHQTNAALKKWAEKAEVNKHVTFGVARHSHATTIIEHTGNAKVASQLLGHTSMRNTEKYIHILDKARRDAVNKIPRME
jgi:integrase/recombinase XerD